MPADVDGINAKNGPYRLVFNFSHIQKFLSSVRGLIVC
jgi:hypothetical protein